MSLQFIEVETTDGVTVATINRPPVNAFSEGLYRDFIALSDMIVANNETRCLVVAAKPDCRAWGGGAELKPADPSPDALHLGPRGLAALYAGTPVAALRAAGLITGGAGLDPALDLAFSGPAPYMLDYF